MKIGCYAALVMMTPFLLAAVPPTPEQYYAQALAVTRALPQPAEVSMAATAVGHNIGVYAGPQTSEPKMATFVIGTGLGTTASWTEHYDSASNSALIDTQTAQSLGSARPLFDPTWHGADVTIDEHTMRFCSLRFRIDKKHERGGTGTVQLDYTQVGCYWLETHSFIARALVAKGAVVEHRCVRTNARKRNPRNAAGWIAPHRAGASCRCYRRGCRRAPSTSP